MSRFIVIQNGLMAQDSITSSKKRAPNYTNTEKELLLNIMDKHRHIIENKKTDGASIKEKKESWQNISEQFNSSAPNLHYRPVESLKKIYEKIKEELRKRTAESKKELYKTGGGPGPRPGSNDKDRQDELLMSIINKKSVEGLGSRFDSNNESSKTIGKEWNEIQNSVNHLATAVLRDVEILEDEENTDFQHEDSELRTQSSNRIEMIYEDSQELYERPSECLPSHLWKKGENLKRPINKILKKNVSKTTQAKNKHEVPSRRRSTTVVPLTSSRLGEKYEQLVDKKLELVECLKKEHELRMQALELN